MRIVSGIYGGRKLQTPKGRNIIRPTSDKIRGAVFNILRNMDVIQGAFALDAFCGSGALGLEALSNGAAHCTFVDKEKSSLDLAQTNASSFNIMDHCDFFQKDITGSCHFLKKRKYDLIFLDPPYRKDIVPLALKGLEQSNSLKNDTVCVLEAEREYNPVLESIFSVQQVKNYGDTKIVILRYTPGQ